MSFTGGQLKLKGGNLPGVKKKKRKETTSLVALDDANADGASPSTLTSSKSEDLKKALHGYSLQEPSENEDRRTAAEKKYDEHMKKLEAERLKKMAAKSHRERIKEFNDHLTNLSEHHDIPKVGPG
ncbi:hypothetical protein CEUSTIGMA_g1390.t1 [Chlamydomonas eustigma]|uniref:FAM32A-like n=1 Tax=Chlamydomonas eustigma TaxID=1157962 RepID=A0A250WTR9_9CHLO|nr:hypothetical protein CEUSTIGMA_g1390.t1 [Chlamydomonas eustigma]|eukprot:GAX73940.1 hypothetical protein CEUSTIGMA_g1390.t1 [Chlamydomonas eustigma]